MGTRNFLNRDFRKIFDFEKDFAEISSSETIGFEEESFEKKIL